MVVCDSSQQKLSKSKQNNHRRFLPGLPCATAHSRVNPRCHRSQPQEPSQAGTETFASKIPHISCPEEEIPTKLSVPSQPPLSNSSLLDTATSLSSDRPPQAAPLRSSAASFVPDQQRPHHSHNFEEIPSKISVPSQRHNRRYPTLQGWIPRRSSPPIGRHTRRLSAPPFLASSLVRSGPTIVTNSSSQLVLKHILYRRSQIGPPDFRATATHTQNKEPAKHIRLISDTVTSRYSPHHQ